MHKAKKLNFNLEGRGAYSISGVTIWGLMVDLDVPNYCFVIKYIKYIKTKTRKLPFHNLSYANQFRQLSNNATLVTNKTLIGLTPTHNNIN